MREEIGILRQCGRCTEWLSIDQFRGLARLCRDCMLWRAPKPIGRSSIRTLSITAKGRAYLREQRALAATVT